MNSSIKLKSPIQIGFQIRNFFARRRQKQFGEYEVVSRGDVSFELPVPDHIPKPGYYLTGVAESPKVPEIKSPETIARMRESCRLAAEILDKCGKFLSIGLTTDELDRFAHNKIIKSNAYPSPLRYQGFPKSICTSVNNVACHGIPDTRKLVNKDIINVDVTVFLNGHHGDCSKTFLIGDVDEKGRRLVQVAEECRDEGIKICRPGVPFKAIGTAIDNRAQQEGYQICPTFCGHGIGGYFHGPPDIYHAKNSFAGFMKAGMTFTVEPVVTQGSVDMELLEDRWTIVSADDARSAQFEHTILITDDGYEILTQL